MSQKLRLILVPIIAVGAFLFEMLQKPAEAAEEVDHDALYAGNEFPSAAQCKQCHPRQYREWSVSPHAYAQISPVFNAMHGEILKRTNGTNGDFCIRCHSEVGMYLKEPLFTPNKNRSPVSREGVTCIVCHRVNKAYAKISGRQGILAGDITQPVYGPNTNERFQKIIKSLRLPPRKSEIHARTEQFNTISKPGFCGTCHDVTLVNGFRLEEAFSEYKMTPAADRGETCQDCHMGPEPGVASHFEDAAAAIVGRQETPARKRTDHMFVGPDYAIVHPAIFPHNPASAEIATWDEWLQFDVNAGWGTPEFEDSVADDYPFPERWEDIADREDARAFIEEQQELLDEIAQKRKRLLQNGYQLGRFVIKEADRDGIDFKVEVKNGTDGHNVPTGFSGERLVYLRVNITDKNGNVIFKSGDPDPNGDVRDLHSLYVHNGELPLDKYLFSLQSKFLTRNVKGGEREQVLAVNYSVSPLPFLRPDTRSTVLTGRTLGARLHKIGIETKGHRWTDYEVDDDALTNQPPYKAKVNPIVA